MNFIQAKLNSWTACSALSPHVPAFYDRHRVLKHPLGNLRRMVSTREKAENGWWQSQWINMKVKENTRASSPPCPSPTAILPRDYCKNSCFSSGFPMLLLDEFGNNPNLKALLAVGMGLNNREAGQLFVLHSKWCLLIWNTRDAISEGDPPLAE